MGIRVDTGQDWLPDRSDVGGKKTFQASPTQI